MRVLGVKHQRCAVPLKAASQCYAHTTLDYAVKMCAKKSIDEIV